LPKRRRDQLILPREKVIKRSLLHPRLVADVFHAHRPIAVPPNQFDSGIEQAIFGVTDTSHDANMIVD